MVLQKGIFVDLASSTTYESVEETEGPITLSVNKESQIFFNKEPISREDLMFYLKGLEKTRSERVVVINADRDATHGQVIALLDLVRQSGLSQAVFTVQSGDSQTL